MKAKTLFLLLWGVTALDAQSISFSPSKGQLGSSFDVIITGTNTNFGIVSSTCVQIHSIATFLQLSNVSVISDSLMQGSLSIPCDLPTGAYDGQALNQACDSLNVSCEDCFTIFGPPILFVYSLGADGNGSLREMIDCATTGDTIKFNAALNGQTITLAEPAINVNKQIYLYTDLANNITISNTSGTNTTSLMKVTDALHSHGLRWDGLTDESLIIEIFTGGSFNVDDSEVNKINIRKN